MFTFLKLFRLPTYVLRLKNKQQLQQFFSPSGSPTISFFDTKRDGNIPTGTPVTGSSNTWGYEKITIFDQHLVLSRKGCKIEP